MYIVKYKITALTETIDTGECYNVIHFNVRPHNSLPSLSSPGGLLKTLMFGFWVMLQGRHSRKSGRQCSVNFINEIRGFKHKIFLLEIVVMVRLLL